MVPQVVRATKGVVRTVTVRAIRTVIGYGATPSGCLWKISSRLLPLYLTGYHTNGSTAYDELHCLKGLNDFAVYHNTHLQQATKELQEEYIM